MSHALTGLPDKLAVAAQYCDDRRLRWYGIRYLVRTRAVIRRSAVDLSGTEFWRRRSVCVRSWRSEYRALLQMQESKYGYGDIRPREMQAVAAVAYFWLSGANENGNVAGEGNRLVPDTAIERDALTRASHEQQR